MAYFITKACTRCGACLSECPTRSIIASVKQFVIDSDTCTDDGACVAVCPEDAIHKMKTDPQSGQLIPPGEADI